jgi:hypothetical protein
MFLVCAVGGTHLQVHFDPANKAIKSLRHAKKYAVPQSPLLEVEWWRVALDEAQLVGHSAAAAMASRLRSQIRWCVTGTPVGPHGVQDLLGLLQFVKVAPYCTPQGSYAWQCHVMQPWREGRSAPLVALLRAVLRRSTKRQVAAEVALPAMAPLRDVRLQQTRRERTFYEEVLSHARKAGASLVALDEEGPPLDPSRPPSSAQEGPQRAGAEESETVGSLQKRVLANMIASQVRKREDIRKCAADGMLQVGTDCDWLTLLAPLLWLDAASGSPDVIG